VGDGLASRPPFAPCDQLLGRLAQRTCRLYVRGEAAGNSCHGITPRNLSSNASNTASSRSSVRRGELVFAALHEVVEVVHRTRRGGSLRRMRRSAELRSGATCPTPIPASLAVHALGRLCQKRSQRSPRSSLRLRSLHTRTPPRKMLVKAPVTMPPKMTMGFQLVAAHH